MIVVVQVPNVIVAVKKEESVKRSSTTAYAHGDFTRKEINVLKVGNGTKIS